MQTLRVQFGKVGADLFKWHRLGYKVVVMGDVKAHISRGEEEVANQNGWRLLNLA